MLDKRVELQGMRADGSTFPVELAISEVRLPHRRLFTAYLRDLTAARSALIVDDDTEVGLVLSDMLTTFGIRCVVAASGEMAVKQLEERDYDVIICDVRLPSIDGPALYGWMAQHRPHLCGRTAFVTGDTLGQASERFLVQARRPLLEKPFLPDDVRRLINDLLPMGDGQENNNAHKK